MERRNYNEDLTGTNDSGINRVSRDLSTMRQRPCGDIDQVSQQCSTSGTGQSELDGIAEQNAASAIQRWKHPAARCIFRRRRDRKSDLHGTARLSICCDCHGDQQDRANVPGEDLGTISDEVTDRIRKTRGNIGDEKNQFNSRQRQWGRLCMSHDSDIHVDR